MRSLRLKSLFQFLISTALVLLLGSPLFYYIMVVFYRGDLDEVIEYRSRQFITQQLPIIPHNQLSAWNKLNPDLQVLPFIESTVIGKPIQKSYYSEASGHILEYRVLYTPVDIEGVPHLLMSRTPMIDKADLGRTIAYQISLVFIFLIIAQTLAHRFVMKRLWRPFYDTLRAMNKFSLLSDNIPKFKATTTREFKWLNDNLQELMVKTLKSYDQQKQFIENASHELQTPLAIIQSQLDLLVQDPDLTPAQNEIIQSLYTVSAQTRRLNKNLLLLAKIENCQYSELEEVDLALLMENMTELFNEIANAEQVSLSLDIKGDNSIQANSSLVQVLITNLISNGIHYNYKGGELKIVLQGNTLQVANTSKTEELDENIIFRRFVRKSVDNTGSGLGLAIVDLICKFHKWEIHYRYDNRFHNFVVDFTPQKS